jgi:hypothetical protein
MTWPVRQLTDVRPYILSLGQRDITLSEEKEKVPGTKSGVSQ